MSDQVTSRSAFQPQPFWDSVKSLLHLNDLMLHFPLLPQRESEISVLHLHREIFQKEKLRTITPLVMSHGNVGFERFVFFPVSKLCLV